MSKDEQDLQFTLDLGGEDKPLKDPSEKKKKLKSASAEKEPPEGTPAKTKPAAKKRISAQAEPKAAEQSGSNGKASVISITDEDIAPGEDSGSSEKEDVTPSLDEATNAAEANPAGTESPQQAAEGGTEASEEIQPSEEVDAGPALMRLAYTADGCWKELEDGTRVELSADEWRAELIHHYRREVPPAIS